MKIEDKQPLSIPVCVGDRLLADEPQRNTRFSQLYLIVYKFGCVNVVQTGFIVT